MDRQIFKSKKVMVSHVCDEYHYYQPIRPIEAENNLLYFWLKQIKVLPAIYLAHDATSAVISHTQVTENPTNLSICFWCFSSRACAFICCTSMVSGLRLRM